MCNGRRAQTTVSRETLASERRPSDVTRFLVWITVICCACAQGANDDDRPKAPGSGGGGNGGSGGASACSMDCSTIATETCYVSRCNESSGNCEVVPGDDGTACDDGLFCTVDDACEGGACKGGPPNDCSMSAGGCQMVTCDEDLDSCLAVPVANGTSCTPDDLCQTGAACQNGACIGTPNDCFFAPVPDECHEAVCNPTSGLCEPVPVADGQSCTDPNDLCMAGKTCSAGLCQGGAPKDCSSLDTGCYVGACNSASGQCALQPGMPGQSCQAPGGACTTGICDVNAVCIPTALPNGTPCDDGNPCTVNDICQSNACGGSVNSQCNKLTASHRGFWTSTGQHGQNGNTFTGKSQSNQILNSYFAFDLSSVSGTVIAAELVLELESYWGSDATETASIWDVATPHSTLVASSFDPMVYQDLQSGNGYGTFTAGPNDVGAKISIGLGSQAVADINAHLGGNFAVGVHIDTSMTNGEQGLRFSSLTEPRIHWLVLTLQ